MSLDVYGEEYNKGYTGCMVVVLWLGSGPTAYIAITTFINALRTGIIEGSYRGNAWSFSQQTDPSGFLVSCIAMGILFLASLALFLYGLYKIIRFFTAPAMQ